MPTISVIIPIYNMAGFVERCMESLRGQTLQDFEVLFVDDHGTDESVHVIEKYIAAQGLEGQWKVFHTPCNKGPGAARNCGIQEATGEYVAFVDGDDWIEPAMLEVLYRNAVAHHADLSSGACVWDYADGTHRIVRNPQIGCGTVSRQQRRYLLRHYASNFTTMLFRREWLRGNGIVFPAAKSGEDSSFMGQCYLMAERIAQTDEPIYHYIIHPQSISHQRGVWRGGEKHRAFAALLHFAAERGLLPTYGATLAWVYLKKAVVMSIVDYCRSLRHF